MNATNPGSTDVSLPKRMDAMPKFLFKESLVGLLI